MMRGLSRPQALFISWIFSSLTLLPGGRRRSMGSPGMSCIIEKRIIVTRKITGIPIKIFFTVYLSRADMSVSYLATSASFR